MTFDSQAQHSPLQQLADLAGIVSEYHDIWGNRHTASDATRIGLLRAMGIACDNETEIADSLASWWTRRWRVNCTKSIGFPPSSTSFTRIR